MGILRYFRSDSDVSNYIPRIKPDQSFLPITPGLPGMAISKGLWSSTSFN